MTDKNIIQERKEKGALTFLTKPLDEKEFLVSVEIHMKKHMEYLQLLNLAPRDKLTGLSNRAAILAYMEDYLALRAYRHLCLILLDIDNFTLFNDKYGYQEGDVLLSHIGKLIKDSLRGYDRTGRYRDQEFLIMLPETSAKEAYVLAETLRTTIETVPLLVAHQKLTITASFGISSLIDNSTYLCHKLKLKNLEDLFDLQNIKNSDRLHIEKTKQKIRDLLLEMAHQALAEAKKAGKNRSLLFKNRFPK